MELSKSKKRKVVVIGLDGVPCSFVQEMTERGELPNLKALFSEGSLIRMRSTIPCVSSVAWSSYMTGRNPGKHNIYGFVDRDPKSLDLYIPTSKNMGSQTLWEALGQQGKRVLVINVPLTYPPEEVNGFLISGLLTPRDCADWAYPKELVQELREQVGTYLIHHDEKYTKSNVENLLLEQHRILQSRTEAALYLIREKQWDFFMVHYYGPDRMTHEFWHLLDPSHPQHDAQERQRFGNVVLDFFRRLDSDLGKLLATLDENVVVILMSDHGMGPVTKFLNVNSWLMSEGYLRLKGDVLTRVKQGLFRAGFNYYTLGKLVLQAGWGKKAVQIGRGRRQELQERVFLSFRDVDWSRTRAYSMGNYGQIYANLRGREPQGCVKPGPEYEALLEELTEKLGSLVDPESGKKVVERVFRAHDVYSGEFVDQAPDLLFLTSDMQYKALGLSDFNSPRVLEPVYGCTGNHRMEGLVALQGNEVIGEGITIEGASIEDLAPTILYLLGVPVPREMDGEVLRSAFSPGFWRAHPVESDDREAMSEPPAERSYSQEEEEELARRLRGLGYV